MTTKTPIEALAATIADFKADPKLRTTTELARNAAGRSVSPTDPTATCFCALGRYAFHRGLADLSVYAELDEDKSLGNITAHEVYVVNDRDETEAGEKIIPHLESLLERLKTPPAVVA